MIRLYLVVAALAAVFFVRLWLHPVPIPVLLLHDVHETRKDIDFWTLHPKRFAELMDLVDRLGLKGLPLADAQAQVEGRLDRERAAQGVLITIDDGCRSAATLVGPELARRGHRGTFFVVTGWGPPDFLAPADWKALGSAGHDVESHSVSHASLNVSSKAAPEAELRRIGGELAESRKVLGARAIAYPKGDFDATTKRLTKQAGYAMGFTTDNGYLVPGLDPYELPRFQLNWDTPLDWIEAYLTAPRDERRRTMSLLAGIVALALIAAGLNRRACASSCHTEEKEMA